MRKKHWLKITLITLAACAVAGLILAVILFSANPGRTSASSSIQFSFNGAAEGIAPNGYRFDLSGFTSEEVLTAALEDAELSEKYTTDQIRENLLVSGVYPENIVQQMTGYESLLTGDAGKISVADYHATLYSVTLYNDFDKSISQADLEKLLQSIMTEFRTQFEKTYSYLLAKDSMLENLTDYDYPQQLELLESSISRYEAVASQMAEDHPEFLLNGEGFGDIATRYETLRSSDLERVSGIVTMNALSQDKDRIESQYENRIKVLEIRLKELEQEAKDTDGLISRYSKDDIIYVSTTGALQQVSGNATETYDNLIKARREIEENIAGLNKELAQTKLKLADIRGEAAKETESEAEGGAVETTSALSAEEYEAQKAIVEKNISSVLKKFNTITESFSATMNAYSEKEMNDSTVAITKIKYDTPKLLSGAFVKQAIKTAGPVCVLGLLVCIVIMINSQRRARKKTK